MKKMLNIFFIIFTVLCGLYIYIWFCEAGYNTEIIRIGSEMGKFLLILACAAEIVAFMVTHPAEFS